MKVFISDIHLTDGTTGPHNIERKDVDLFWNDIQIGGLKPQDVEIIILGDFFDVIRSTRWGEKQPWHDPSSVSSTVIDIVTETIKLNSAPLGVIKAHIQEGVKVSYVIGNHDRLINEVPEARILVRKALGLEPSEVPFPLKFDDPSLSIYATHGNEADVYNCFAPDGFLIGDAIVTLLINPFPEHELLKDYPDIKKSLQEIDNLRPTTVAPLWIEHCMKPFKEEIKGKVKEAWKRLVEEFYKNLSVKGWFDEYDSWVNPVDKADQLQIAFEYFTESTMQRLMEKMLEIRNDFYKPKDEYIKKAADYMSEKDCRYIIFGHTHEPRIHLIGESEKGGRFYVNTGTWRQRIFMGEPRKKIIPFAPLKTISYVQFYEGEERGKTGRDFEVWDGSIV